MRKQQLYPKYCLSPDELFSTGISNVPVDDGGVAMWDYKGYIGLHKEYNPALISSYALSMYNLYCDTSKEKYLKRFFENTDFLVKNFTDKGDYGVWLYNFPWIAPFYLCEPPWASGLCQGRGISVMIRAWALTSDEEYLKIAKKALGSFMVPTSKGGVMKAESADSWWYTWGTGERGKVLNAHLFALIGIHELYDVTKDSNAKFLFNKGIKTVKNIIDKYDLDVFLFKWSKYDDKLFLYSGPKYHKFHIRQLMKLYEITGDKEFFDWAMRWRSYQEKYSWIQNSKWFIIIWNSYVKVIKKLAQYSHKI